MNRASEVAVMDFIRTATKEELVRLREAIVAREVAPLPKGEHDVAISLSALRHH